MELVRRVREDKVRKFCIDNNLYTCGNNAEYEQMFHLCGLAIKDRQFVAIAKNIYNHSDIDRLNAEGADLETIVWGFLNHCIETEIIDLD